MKAQAHLCCITEIHLEMLQSACALILDARQLLLVGLPSRPFMHYFSRDPTKLTGKPICHHCAAGETFTVHAACIFFMHPYLIILESYIKGAHP